MRNILALIKGYRAHHHIHKPISLVTNYLWKSIDLSISKAVRKRTSMPVIHNKRKCKIGAKSAEAWAYVWSDAYSLAHWNGLWFLRHRHHSAGSWSQTTKVIVKQLSLACTLPAWRALPWGHGTILISDIVCVCIVILLGFNSSEFRIFKYNNHL